MVKENAHRILTSLIQNIQMCEFNPLSFFRRCSFQGTAQNFSPFNLLNSIKVAMLFNYNCCIILVRLVFSSDNNHRNFLIYFEKLKHRLFYLLFFETKDLNTQKLIKLRWYCVDVQHYIYSMQHSRRS